MLKNIFPQDKAVSREVFTLAFPVILSNLSRVLMSVVDVAMVGRLGAEALAATGMGAMLFWGALSLVLGIRTAVQTVASRRLGQKIRPRSRDSFPQRAFYGDSLWFSDVHRWMVVGEGFYPVFYY